MTQESRRDWEERRRDSYTQERRVSTVYNGEIETGDAVDLIERIHRVFCGARYVEQFDLSPCHAPHWCLCARKTQALWG
jgi:hypothetical protein